MNNYWTTSSTGYTSNWVTTTSFGKTSVKYTIKKK